MGSFSSAIQFLTVIPVRGSDRPPGSAAGWFPLVGALLGLGGAGIYLAMVMVAPVPIAALLTVLFWTMITGVLHEDGLADVADALRAGRGVDRMHAILKDSRIGTYGAVALVFSVLIRWQAIANLGEAEPWRVAAIFVAAQSISRAGLVALAWTSRPVRDGLGFQFLASLGTGSSLLAIAQGVIAAALCGPRAAILIVLGVYAILRLLQGWFYRRLGGVTGDCLGAASQIVECFVLLLFTCHDFTS